MIAACQIIALGRLGGLLIPKFRLRIPHPFCESCIRKAHTLNGTPSLCLEPHPPALPFHFHSQSTLHPGVQEHIVGRSNDLHLRQFFPLTLPPCFDRLGLQV